MTSLSENVRADESATREAQFRAYVDAGLALIPVEHGSKGPGGPGAVGWKLRENAITKPEQLGRIGRGGVGLAHAYSYTAAIDCDALEKNRAWLCENGIDLDALLNAPDAVQIASGRENRAKLLYKWPAGVEPLQSVKSPDGSLEFRCRDAGGTVQDVLPPSIHPSTGKPYRWAGAGHFSAIPTLPDALLELWRKLLKESGAINTKSKSTRIEEARARDEVYQALRDQGRIISDGSDGSANINCPFAAEHSTPTKPGDCRYFPKNTGGFSAAAIKCLHAHCDGRKMDDYREALGLPFGAALAFEEFTNIEPPDPFELASSWNMTEIQEHATALSELRAKNPQRFSDLVDLWSMLSTIDTAELAQLLDIAAVPDYVAELNEEWFVVNDSGAAMVGRFTRDPALNHRRTLHLSTVNSFKALYENKFSNRGKPAGAEWLKHPQRREYLGGITFAPGRTVPANTLNLWQGYGVDPVPGDWSLMKNHIRDIICAGNPAHFEYLARWMARAVQRPGDVGEVAIVLRGGRGTGKGCFGRAMVQMFGQHGTHITNPQHLTGQFNQHLHDTALLFVDEAFFAGDKKNEGVLKGLITEDTMMIEGKFRNAIQAPNYLHIVVASNDSHLVPAGEQERRYAVFDVADDRQQDHDYFAAIKEQMDSGGLAAMLHDLLRINIDSYNVRAVPQTDALAEQKDHSLRGPLRWLRTCLEEGRINYWDSRDLRNIDWDSDALEVSKRSMFDAYSQWHTKVKDEYRAVRQTQFWKELRKVFPSLPETRPAANRDGRDRSRTITLPPIEQGRALFDAYLGGSAGWD